jgi:type IV secretion system protein VirB10
VPQLGEPLPSDLGRPILDHQRPLDMAGLTDPTDAAGQRAAQAAEAERQRLAAAQRAARESGVMKPTLSITHHSAGGRSSPPRLTFFLSEI